MNLKAESLFSVAGKVALVTGATGHLGNVMCRCLKDNGAYVIGVGRTFPKDMPEFYGGKHIDWFIDGDLSMTSDMYNQDRAEWLSPLHHGLERMNRSINILVNNAHDMSGASGFNISHGNDTDHVGYYNDREWETNLAFLNSSALLTEYCGNQMKVNGGGSIINISSMYALVAPSPLLYEDTHFMNPPGYGATKAGLLAFTRYTASFWGRYGIRCNAICPGPFPKAITDENRDFIQRLNDRTCLGRTGRPEEIAGPLLFLASDASSYVTGHALVADGGWTII